MISNLAKWLKLHQISLKKKLITTYIMLTAIPMAIIGYIIYYENTKAMEEEVGEYLPRLLNQANKNMENELNQLNDLPNAIYNSSDVMSILRATPYKEKAAFLQDKYTVESFLAKTYLDSKKSEIIGAFLLTSNGNYINTKMPYTGFNVDESSTPFGGLHDLAGESQIILPNKTNLTFEDHTPFLLVINEIVDVENRTTIGTLILAVKVSFIADILKDIDKEERALMWVMNKDGYIIYHPKESLIGTMDKEMQTYPILNGSFRTTNSYSNRTLYSINQSNQHQWILVHRIPMNYLTGRTDTVKNAAVILFIFLVIVTTVLSILIALSVTKPIQTLGKKMKEVEKGNLRVQIPVGKKDEVGELANSFQSMLIQLQELIKKNYETELQQRDAKIHALQLQINPHFMYNTLETIGAVIEEEETETATEMVSILGQMLRYSLSDSRNLVSLEQELHHIKNYLTLQKIRFDERVTYTIKDETNGKYYTPKFIFQPILENSFKYGMSKRKVLHVTISVYKNAEILEIEITDNGPGISEETLQKIQGNLYSNDYFRKESGLGLTNVHARIVMMFGNSFGLTVRSSEGFGTKMMLKLPLITESEMLNRISTGNEGGREND